MQEQLEKGQGQVSSDAVFQSPLEDFDVLVRLRPEALPYPDRALTASPDSLPSSIHDDEENEHMNHKQARARLHSIPKGMCACLCSNLCLCRFTYLTPRPCAWLYVCSMLQVALPYHIIVIALAYIVHTKGMRTGLSGKLRLYMCQHVFVSTLCCWMQRC